MYMVLFGLMEIVLSQFPSLDKVTLISVVAAVMSFTYSFIGLFLSAVKFASHHRAYGTLLGVKIGGADGVSAPTKAWRFLQALGNIAFAYTYSMLLIEIQAHSCTLQYSRCNASMPRISITLALFVNL